MFPRTNLGTGECLVSVLDEKGRPSPLVRCMMRAPVTRMDILTAKELKAQINGSDIHDDYAKEIDSESAYEILNDKIEKFQKQQEKRDKKENKVPKKTTKKSTKKNQSLAEKLSKNTMVRQVAREATRQVVRGVLGSLGIKTSSKTKSKTGWF